MPTKGAYAARAAKYPYVVKKESPRIALQTRIPNDLNSDNIKYPHQSRNSFCSKNHLERIVRVLVGSRALVLDLQLV